MLLNIVEIYFLLIQRNKAELTILIKKNNYSYSDDLLKLLVYLNEEILFEKYNLPKSLNSSGFISIFKNSKGIESDLFGRSIWHYLAWSGNAKALRELAEECKIELNSLEDIDIYGETLLYFLARSGNAKALRELAKEHKVRLDSLKNNHGTTVLHYLAQSGNSKALRELAKEYKVELDSLKSDNGLTLLHYLAFSGNAKALRELAEEYKIELDSLKDNDGATLLHCLAFSGNSKALRELAKEYKIELDSLKDNNGLTLLHYLAHGGNGKALRELVEEYKIDLDSLRDNYGLTVLHYLALSGNSKVLFELAKEYKVRLDSLKDNYGSTVLHYLAATNSFLGLCHISYYFEINPSKLKNICGKTPWDFIPQNSFYKKTAKILNETHSLTDKILGLKTYLLANLDFLDVYAFLNPVSYLFSAKQNQAIKEPSKRGVLNSMLVLGTEIGKKQFLKKLNKGRQGPDMPNTIWQLITFYALEQEHSIYTDDSSKNREIQNCYTKVFCKFTKQLPDYVVAGLFFCHGKPNSCASTTYSNDSALYSNQNGSTNIATPLL